MHKIEFDMQMFAQLPREKMEWKIESWKNKTGTNPHKKFSTQFHLLENTKNQPIIMLQKTCKN